ncbi:MAG: class B sortase [Clostridiales bacterium]|nr:class B sortase [Clostridiales bacterium]
MKTICGLVKIIETVMKVIVAVVATVIILFAAYSLYDSFYINRHAFSSYELKQYKPIPVIENDDNGNGSDYDQDGFSQLKEVNPDARGWITIYDTNIDYPFVQGEDDLEYASKDIYGKSSITGAIYMKTENSEDLSDPYNIIFGHHMDNGAMFGDLEKYKKEDYFNSHIEGWLYAAGRYYKLEVFAEMMTDAYDENVYSIDKLKISERIEYIHANSDYVKQLSESDKEAMELFETEGPAVLDDLQKSGDPAMIIALSTCESAITNGRIVVFCKATPVDFNDILGADSSLGNNGDNGDNEPSVIEKLKAIGHPFGADSWGFLNLVCLVYCVLVVLPLAKTGLKFRQITVARKVKDIYNGYGYDGADAMAIVKYGDDIKKKLKRFSRRMNWGSALEIIMAVVALVVFFLTQDMTAPVVMCDSYTPLMIGISVIMLTVDILFFVYRGNRILTPDEVAQMPKPEGNKR